VFSNGSWHQAMDIASWLYIGGTVGLALLVLSRITGRSRALGAGGLFVIGGTALLGRLLSERPPLFDSLDGWVAQLIVLNQVLPYVGLTLLAGALVVREDGRRVPDVPGRTYPGPSGPPQGTTEL
jgi:hypothetical protein